MKKIIILLGFSLLLVGCGQKETDKETIVETNVDMETTAPENETQIEDTQMETTNEETQEQETSEEVMDNETPNTSPDNMPIGGITVDFNDDGSVSIGEDVQYEEAKLGTPFNIGNSTVTINDLNIVYDPFNDSYALKISFNWKNGSSETLSGLDSFIFSGYQDNADTGIFIFSEDVDTTSIQN